MVLHTDHAVVLGASLGGLMAARILSDTYAQVTLIERDVLDPSPEPRKGVPQGRHAHMLLARGREAMEELFAGLTDELVALGVPKVDVQSQIRWISDGRTLAHRPSGLVALGSSRPLLESRIRARVLAIPNLKVLDGCEVSGLLGSIRDDSVIGVRLLRNGEQGPGEKLYADLVLDATGRAARGVSWMQALGFPVPETETVEVGLVYGTRLYRRDPSMMTTNTVMSPAFPRVGAMLAQEGDRWIVTLGGVNGDAAPLDHEGYTAYAATLSAPIVYDVIRDAEPLSDPVRMRYPACARRRYERLPHVPEGYLAYGDAITSFSPTYGQGMTSSACQALALRDCLQEGLDALPRRFYKAAADIIDIPWSIAANGDGRLPGVPGKQSPQVRLMNTYLDQVWKAGSRDPDVSAAFLRVVNLMEPPQSLLRPSTALRVLRGSLLASHRGASSRNPLIRPRIQ
ncbi:FAD-dependent oxidoreductase (plasmid) [Mycolicibacterium psychrotolerans]|uniref:FAD-dependent oxidoreductase n=1 Tax=Mycolicibacterium psychrotolerans TaxID=216929 RepID=UPI003D67821D